MEKYKMKNLAFKVFKVEEAVTNVNGQSKTSRLTKDTLYINALIFEREDGNFYNGTNDGEAFRIFHRFATDNLELDVLPLHNKNKSITITNRTEIPF